MVNSFVMAVILGRRLVVFACHPTPLSRHPPLCRHPPSLFPLLGQSYPIRNQITTPPNYKTCHVVDEAHFRYFEWRPNRGAAFFSDCSKRPKLYSRGNEPMFWDDTDVTAARSLPPAPPLSPLHAPLKTNLLSICQSSTSHSSHGLHFAGCSLFIASFPPSSKIIWVRSHSKKYFYNG